MTKKNRVLYESNWIHMLNCCVNPVPLISSYVVGVVSVSVFAVFTCIGKNEYENEQGSERMRNVRPDVTE
jgi:hypothetical protein